MSTEQVRLDRDGHIAVITIDRPERRNALNRQLWTQLGKRADELAASLPRVVILTGAGDVAFSAGMDVNPDNPQVAELTSAVQKGDEAPVRAMLDEIHAALDRLFALPVPIIAAVNGLAYGGGAEIATRCDLRVMDEAAKLCFSEVRLGLMPDLGGGIALAHLIGSGRGADLILSARKVEAAEALQLGWANRVVATGTALDTAAQLGRDIAANGPSAVRAATQILRRGQPSSEAIRAEVDAAVALIAGGECVHGITAFMTRTEPKFPDPT